MMTVMIIMSTIIRTSHVSLITNADKTIKCHKMR